MGILLIYIEFITQGEKLLYSHFPGGYCFLRKPTKSYVYIIMIRVYDSIKGVRVALHKEKREDILVNRIQKPLFFFGLMNLQK